MNTRTNAVLDADTIAGPFSLTGREPVQVYVTPGTVVQVRIGAVAISRAYDPREYLVRAGARFVAERAGHLVLEPLGRAELRIEGPAEADERLSPGLEPVGLSVLRSSALGTQFDARASWAVS